MQVDQFDGYANVILPEVVDLINAPNFKQALKTLYEEGCNAINVDCSHLEMIDSAGLGSLVFFQNRLRNRGGELKLVNVTNDYIKHLFETIDLARVISIEYSR
jgi:anti-sigma B factor antagonist